MALKGWLWNLYVLLLVLGLIALTHRLGLDNFQEGDMGTVLLIVVFGVGGFAAGYFVARNNNPV